MISRQIGKILRGNATPFQLFAACVLGSLLAFLPGLTQAPGAIVILVFVIIVLNANLALAVLLGVVAKLSAILLLPVSFEIGRFLLDGPTSGLFRAAINAPVLALCGFEYYTVTGGLAMGLVFGLVSGFLIVRGMTAFRAKMAKLEESSEGFKKLSSSKMARLAAWVFLGGAAKKNSYEELLEKKVGLPIRPLGVVFVVLLAIVIFAVVQLGKGPIMTMALQNGLEQANGATVDVGNAEIDFKENRLTITGLAIADATDLKFDLLRAAKLEADIGTASLLTKRLKLDRVVISDAQYHAERKISAYRVRDLPEPTPPTKDDGEGKTLDDYLEQAKEWKERLAKLKEWIEKASGPQDEDGKTKSPSPDSPEELEDWLRKGIEAVGYENVVATHLLDKVPTFTIGELLAEAVRVPDLPDETLEIRAKNLSTQPWLIAEEKSVVITSSKDSVGARIQLGGGATNAFAFHYRGLPTDKVASGLKLGGEQAVSGGTIDVSSAGSWAAKGGDVIVDLPLEVVLNNANINVSGAGSTPVEKLRIPIGVVGPLDNPRIRPDTKAFASVLTGLVKSKATQMLKDKAGAELKKALGDKIAVPKDAGKLLKGLFGK
jgi:uncharacterized protein (TIGR03546 family)